jgi:hypothetical protein
LSRFREIGELIFYGGFAMPVTKASARFSLQAHGLFWLATVATLFSAPEPAQRFKSLQIQYSSS